MRPANFADDIFRCIFSNDSFFFKICCYTVRQLDGIALPVRLFGSQLAETGWRHIMETFSALLAFSATLWRKVMVDDHFCSISVIIFHESTDFPIRPQTVCPFCIDHIQPWAVVVYEIRSETKLVIIPTNIRAVIIENIVQFSDRGLSQKEMSKNH